MSKPSPAIIWYLWYSPVGEPSNFAEVSDRVDITGLEDKRQRWIHSDPSDWNGLLIMLPDGSMPWNESTDYRKRRFAF